MPVELPIQANALSGNDLVEIFRLFCKAYNIESTKRDEEFLNKYGIKSLVSEPGGLDYRPYMGAKFFGFRVGDAVKFHGYVLLDDTDWQAKDVQFGKLVLQHFSKKLK